MVRIVYGLGTLIKSKQNLFLHLGLTLFFLLFFGYVTFEFKPQPVSDYQYYWIASTDPKIYIKGGVFLFCYGLLKKLELQPYVAALIINSIFWIAISYAFWINKRTFLTVRKKYQFALTIALLPIGLWWAGYSPQVNADFPNLALLAVGIKLLVDHLMATARYKLILSIVCLTLAINIRLKTGLVLIIFMVLALVLGLIFKKRIVKERFVKITASVLILSIALGFALDYGSRAFSDATLDKQLQGRVQLYTGLYMADQNGDGLMGSWSPQAVEQATNDLDKSMVSIFFEQIKKRSLLEWSKIVAIKMARVLSFDSFSFDELYSFSLINRTDVANDNSMLFPEKTPSYKMIGSQSIFTSNNGSNYFQFSNEDPVKGEVADLVIPLKNLKTGENYTLSFNMFDGYDAPNFPGRFEHRVFIDNKLMESKDISGDTKSGWTLYKLSFVPQSDEAELKIEIAAVGAIEKGWNWSASAKAGIQSIQVTSVDGSTQQIKIGGNITKLDMLHKLANVESKVVTIFKYIIWFMLVFVLYLLYAYRAYISKLPYFMLAATVLLYASYILIHVPFEIQARYMAEPMVVTYMLGIYAICLALANRHDRSEPQA